MKPDTAVRDGADVFKNLYRQAQLLHPLTDKRSLESFSGLELSARELPDPGMPLILCTPEEDHLVGPLAAEDASHHLYLALERRPGLITQWGRLTR